MSAVAVVQNGKNKFLFKCMTTTTTAAVMMTRRSPRNGNYFFQHLTIAIFGLFMYEKTKLNVVYDCFAKSFYFNLRNIFERHFKLTTYISKRAKTVYLWSKELLNGRTL